MISNTYGLGGWHQPPPVPNYVCSSLNHSMIYQVTNIRFDFTDSEEEISIEEQTDLNDEVINTIWEADDEEDLVEEITCAYGWCISAIDYRHVLS